MLKAGCDINRKRLNERGPRERKVSVLGPAQIVLGTFLLETGLVNITYMEDNFYNTRLQKTLVSSLCAFFLVCLRTISIKDVLILIVKANC